MRERQQGSRLAEIRNDRRMTQQELGDAVGVSHAAINNWEHDKRKVHNDHLVALAQVLRCSTDNIIRDKIGAPIPRARFLGSPKKARMMGAFLLEDAHQSVMDRVTASAAASMERTVNMMADRIQRIIVEGRAGMGRSSFTLPLIVSLIIAALAEPMPWPQRGGSCPHGYYSSNGYCMPGQGAQEAIPKNTSGNCPFGWTSSGAFCLKSGR